MNTFTDHDLDLQIAREEMTRGIRRRACQVVPDLDGLIRRNTLREPA